MIKFLLILILSTQACFAPIIQLPVFHRTDLVLDFNNFQVGWNNELDSPIWASYYISNQTKQFALNRPLEPFKRDERVHTDNVGSHLYTNSGYDRGHLVPSYAMGAYYGLGTQLDTYYLSNIVPQLPKLNRVQIRKIESSIAKFKLFTDIESQQVYITIDLSDEKIHGIIPIPDHFVITVYGINFEKNKRQTAFFFLSNKKQ